MADFSAFRESNRIVDQAVQFALRDTDSRSLALALLLLSEADRHIFLRNMSVRAASLLGDDIAELERHVSGTYDKASASSQEVLHRKVTKYRRIVEENERLTPAELPPLGWATEEELVQGLVALKRYSARNGAASLEPLLSGELHPLLRKGLRLYVDGWDPSAVQSILEQLRESAIVRERNKMDIMIEGVAALFGHDLPQVVEEKLGAFRLSDPGHEPRRGS